MNTIVVIPARYQSSRFLGKPLALLRGKPMIWHVWSRATQIKMADKVIVATEDDKIADLISMFGGEVMLTSATHRTGSDRVAEVAALYKDVPLVVNLQGDLPLFRPSVIDRIIQEGAVRIRQGADLITLTAKINLEEEIFSPNTVKVVRNDQGEILYFSRSPIPYLQKDNFSVCPFGYFKHYGVYLYHREFLLKMANCPQGDLERMERLEQLRVLEHGGRVWAMEIDQKDAQGFCEVNTPEDLILAEKMLATDHYNQP